MNFLQYYYDTIIKYDMINKFNYNKKNVNLPKLKKIILNIHIKQTDIINFLIPTILSLELVSLKKSKLTHSKSSNIVLKIKKGNICGCKVTLKQTKMYFFIFKLILDILPKINKKFVINNNSFFYNKFFFKIETILIFSELEPYYKFFKNISFLNVTILTNSLNKYEFLFLLKAFKIV